MVSEDLDPHWMPWTLGMNPGAGLLALGCPPSLPSLPVGFVLPVESAHSKSYKDAVPYPSPPRGRAGKGLSGSHLLGHNLYHVYES